MARIAHAHVELAELAVDADAADGGAARQARHGLRARRTDIVSRQQRAELARVDEAGDVARAVHLGGAVRGSIMPAGAIELPPESEVCEPMSVSSSPRAPAFMMPYIGLCGLLPVSFSERAAIEHAVGQSARAPRRVRSSMPRRIAPSEWQAAPNCVSMKLLVALAAFGAFGTMSPGRPSFA